MGHHASELGVESAQQAMKAGGAKGWVVDDMSD
jgi:hypothetical protein